MPKANEELLEDGWTRVNGKKKNTPTYISGLPQLAKDATVDKLMSDFEKKMKIWQSSSCRKEVQKMLNRECPDDGWSFNKAICLASGSFSRDNWECTKRSVFQFVAFIDTVQRLQARSSNPIQMLAQDPNYTELDMEFLALLGVKPLDTSLNQLGRDLNLAKDHLGAHSVVFELFMDMGCEVMLDLYNSDTPLHIGSAHQWRLQDRKGNYEPYRKQLRDIGYNEMSIASNVNQRKEECTLVDQFVKNHRSRYFPRFEEDPLVFEGLMFHWKEPKDDNEADEG